MLCRWIYVGISLTVRRYDNHPLSLDHCLLAHLLILLTFPIPLSFPQEALTMTEVAQPAILTTSIALLRALEAEKGVSLKDLASVALGHSLGEYTALVATGALPLAKAVCLVRLRGLAMTEAVSHFSFPTSMSALMVRKRRLDSLIELIQSLPQADDPAMIAEIANINSVCFSFEEGIKGGGLH